MERLVRVALCAACKPSYCLEPSRSDAVARLLLATGSVYGHLRASGASKGDIMNGLALLAEEPRRSVYLSALFYKTALAEVSALSHF